MKVRKEILKILDEFISMQDSRVILYLNIKHTGYLQQNKYRDKLNELPSQFIYRKKFFEREEYIEDDDYRNETLHIRDITEIEKFE